MEDKTEFVAGDIESEYLRARDLLEELIISWRDRMSIPASLVEIVEAFLAETE